MSDLNEKFDEFNNTNDSTDEFDPADIEQNRIIAVFAYLSWLVLVPIFAAKDSKFARFHANQGLVLAIVEIFCGIVLGFFSNLPLVGWIFSLVGSLFGLVCLVFAVLGIVNAAGGRAKDLPIIGKFRILK